MARGPEFQFDRPSAAALTAMPESRLTALHKSLSARRASSTTEGGSFLRQKSNQVGNELRRRKRLADRADRQDASPSQLVVPQFETVHATLGELRADAPLRVEVVGGHFDDWAMGGGLIVQLIEQGADVSVTTLTSGDKGGVPRTRWKEERRFGRRAVVRNLDAIFLPDGELTEHLDEATEFFEGVVEQRRPDVIIAPAKGDPHDDHAASHLVALEVAGDTIPVHGMQTIWGVDYKGDPNPPDRLVPISAEVARRAQELYLGYTSQTGVRTRDVQRVLDMSKISGERIDVDHAVGYFAATNVVDKDPLGEFVVYKTI